ncbi:MAG: DUF2946 family protein [Burkholderiales bacterium]
MDDIVKAALKKWPAVPAVYGWLGLDARGDWYLRDDAVQAAGPFPQAKGSRIVHEKLRDFIQRNYDSDDGRAWYFQNGPQRVYVELEAAPWVLGVQRLANGAFAVATHTGQPVPVVEAAWVDEQGRLFLATPQGLGLVRSMDMDAAADAAEANGWDIQDATFVDLLARYRHQLSPGPQPA